MRYESEKNYIERKIDAFFENWKRQKERVPLIVKGARQVGKTESIRHFARKNYASFVEINFAEQKKFKDIVRDGYSAGSIVSCLSFIEPSFSFVPGKTLIFFDEIQEFPEIATAFKFFAQDGSYDIIASGSLLGVHYARIGSISVGYQKSYTLRSLDFEEFLWSLGYRKSQTEGLLEQLLARKPFIEAVKGTMDRLFMNYCALGGMPRVIVEYLKNRTFEGVLDIQTDIVEAYRSDVRKYSEGLDPVRIQAVFDAVPEMLARENKKFKYSAIENGARKKDYFGCIEWLKDAGVVNVCQRLANLELPMAGNLDHDSFKVYFSDSGLLCSMLDQDSQNDIRARRNLGTWKGGFFENVVAESLVKAGEKPVYYKKENSTLEMDFLMRCGDSLVPVEVKAENSRSKSLKTLLANGAGHGIDWGIKLINGNVGFESRILSLPQWCAFLLPRLIRELAGRA